MREWAGGVLADAQAAFGAPGSATATPDLRRSRCSRPRARWLSEKARSVSAN